MDNRNISVIIIIIIIGGVYTKSDQQVIRKSKWNEIKTKVKKTTIAQ